MDKLVACLERVEMNELPELQPILSLAVHFHIHPFHQDTTGWTSPEGKYFPPTFKYASQITCVRKEDGQHFFVVLVVPEDVTSKDPYALLREVRDRFHKALLSLENYLKVTPLCIRPPSSNGT